ncbi:ABC transporter C family member 10-like [Salvia splendens]|uniref:ABC transporter C family member 10-like n=1 Tax=Salvia splendens TaxID=180675 RepID=UPI001100061D|nr:ABC transporter C family member 10-like [Salvia splendens]XP_042032116.1 ABC transporter C family member 10-like [Salvia splendens]
MGSLWSVFCGEHDCAGGGGGDGDGVSCSADLSFVTQPSSCSNHALIVCFDVLLLVMLCFTVFFKKPLKSSRVAASFRSNLQLASAIYNGFLGLAYLCFGVWILEEKLRKLDSVLPLHWWVLYLFHGLVWLLLGLAVSLRGHRFSRTPLRLLSSLAFLFAAITCGISVFTAVLSKEMSVKIVFDILSFVGSSMLILCVYKGYRNQEDGDGENGVSDPLLGVVANGSGKTSSRGDVTPFAEAGFLNKLTFWWLNPLMKRGKEKTLEDEDMPKLRQDDRAESCYLLFSDIYNKQKESSRSSPPSILKIILLCHWKEILVSGLYACLKVVALSLGPVLLNAFINVAEGNARSEYEKYMLVAALFLTKTTESLAQRQWYFKSRLVGLKLRSLLTAAVYQKQLKLSNAARLTHSSGEIMSYVTVDAYRIGEFPFWFHQIWTTSLQLCLAVIILFNAVGLATFASIVVILLSVLCNMPLAKLQHKFQSRLMVAQDGRLKAMSEALVNMKVLKLYAWETHFRHVVENLRKVEEKCLSAVQLRKAYNSYLFWSSPVLVSAATFGACYVLGVPLSSSNVFTFVATLRLVQDPIRTIPDVLAVFIQANVAFVRLVKFLEAPELEASNARAKSRANGEVSSVSFKSADLSWDEDPSKPTLRNINLELRQGEKIAICGEVGSGKSTLLAAVLREVPITRGTVQVQGSIAYVSQSAWIQTGSIRENILFGSAMDSKRYQDTLERCSLVKDLELLPYGDLTEIGERGINLSGGQKQRIQLARALYKNADVYLLDDPFSAVDAHTATSLFNEYIVGALSGKTVLLVTHQVDFLPAFDSVLLMSDGEILCAAPYSQLLESSKEFQDLIHAHRETAGSEGLSEMTEGRTSEASSREIRRSYAEQKAPAAGVDQLIKKEEREVGDTGFKPYLLYLKQNKGFLTFGVGALCHLTFVVGQILQNSWMAANVDDPNFDSLRLILVYLLIGFVSTVFLLGRTLTTVVMGVQSSRALFSQLLISLFRAPMAFYDSTPLGRILSRVSADLSIVDLDLPFNLIFTVGSTTNCYANLAVLAIITWQVLFVSIPMIILAIRLQSYYYCSAKELMRINGTTKSLVANHLAESVAGVTTIRAFNEEDRFLEKNLELIDTNGSPYFNYFSANEWLIQRLEIISATVLSFAGLCMVLLPTGTFSSGFIGMALSYGLSLNMSLVFSINNQCMLSNYIISVERLDQYMHIPSEAPEVVEESRPPTNWPSEGRVEIHDLKIRYREDAPLVLRGISCTFEGGHKIGIVGRTGSGKTTLISALFRLVEPAGGRIVVDGIDISTIGLHDLRSHFGIIPQDPTLFTGTVRYNLDPLGQHSDMEIWEVLGKCQLKEVVQEKEEGLNAPVVEDGSNWSMGQRQLFCLGRALLRRSKVLVLDEATASIDNATDTILQKTIRTEFADCTVITVAHRIPTVMDSTMVLAISDGKLVEYDEPMKLMKREGSLFGELVKEYWSHNNQAVQSQ